MINESESTIQRISAEGISTLSILIRILYTISHKVILGDKERMDTIMADGDSLGLPMVSRLSWPDSDDGARKIESMLLSQRSL